MNTQIENLFDFIFWCNPFEKENELVWYAIHRDYQLQFFNGHRDESKFIKGTDMATLQTLVCRPDILAKENKK